MILYKLISDVLMTADFIIVFWQMALNMAGSQDNCIKQLSKHTATAIYHTCNGIISPYQQLLDKSHKYLLLRQSTTEPLKKEFNKLCQG